MKFTADPEFDRNDCILIHRWIEKRGWSKEAEDPFKYSKFSMEGTGEVAFNLFDAMKREINLDLEEATNAS